MAASSTSTIGSKDQNCKKEKPPTHQTCKYCLAQFVTSASTYFVANSYFARNQRTAHYTSDGQLVYFCSKCPRKIRVYYSKEEELLAHVKSKHDQDRREQRDEDASDGDVPSEDLSKTEQSDRLSMGTRLLCKYCLGTYTSSALWSHQRLMHFLGKGAVVYFCSKCPGRKKYHQGRQFSNEKALLAHVAKKHGEKKKNGVESKKDESVKEKISTKEKDSIGEDEKNVKMEESGEFTEEPESSNLSAWTILVKTEPVDSDAIDAATAQTFSNVKMEPLCG